MQEASSKNSGFNSFAEYAARFSGSIFTLMLALTLVSVISCGKVSSERASAHSSTTADRQLERRVGRIAVEKLQHGMSEEQVVELLGRPDEERSKAGLGTVTWKNSNCSLTVKLQDRRVAGLVFDELSDAIAEVGAVTDGLEIGMSLGKTCDILGAYQRLEVCDRHIKVFKWRKLNCSVELSFVDEELTGLLVQELN